MPSVLFVCLGNICRSPLAEGIFRTQVQEAGLEANFDIDSAGCGGWHAGESPDRRSIAVATRHGLDISNQRARKVNRDDFSRFDLILGMDRDNVAHLNGLRPKDARARVALYLDEAMGAQKDVPDPYYGGTADFEAVYQLCEKAGVNLLKKLAKG